MSLDFYLNYKIDGNEVGVFSNNMTHNLTEMAGEAGLYEALWHPDRIGAKKANDIIEVLAEGIKKLELNPEKFKKFNPENGWGSYEGLLRFCRECLDACVKYPNAEIYSSV